MPFPYLKQLTALYVEDDPIIRFQATAMLEEHLGKLVCAEDGNQGLEAFHSREFDMVMLDITMPGIDGVQLSREIKALRPKQKIVVLSSTGDARRLIELVNIGVDRFVPKPIDYDLLLDYLEGVARQYHHEKQIRAYQALLEEKNNELEATLSQLKSTQDQLIESEKMASLGGLVTGMAHEMNTPVGVCITASSLMQDQIRTVAQKLEANTLTRSEMVSFMDVSREQGDLLMRNLNRTAEMIQVFKRISADEFVENAGDIDFRSIFNTVCFELGSECQQRQITVQTEVKTPLPFRSFRGALVEVTKALVVNAVEHAYPCNGNGGVVRLKADTLGQNAVVSVIDEGIGISPQEKEKIFLPFHKKAGGKGLGLGLSVAYNLAVHRLGGSLLCDSSPGRGSCFQLVIPRTAPQPAG